MGQEVFDVRQCVVGEYAGKFVVARRRDQLVWDGPIDTLEQAVKLCDKRNKEGDNKDIKWEPGQKRTERRMYGIPIPVLFAASAVRAPGNLPPRFIDRLTSAQRKQFPMATGLIDYAPDALAAVSHVSWVGNEKHNPGQPLHHARSKSMDQADCEVRHLSTRGDIDPAYAGDPIEKVSHLAQKAWRSIMELQVEMERVYNLPLPRGARE